MGEALGIPEITALGNADLHCRATMEAKAKAILEDSALCTAVSLHRRRMTAKPEVREVEISVEPPKRAADWEEPVRLRLPVVRWVEEGELHQAYVPALGILVFAPREVGLPGSKIG